MCSTNDEIQTFKQKLGFFFFNKKGIISYTTTPKACCLTYICHYELTACQHLKDCNDEIGGDINKCDF